MAHALTFILGAAALLLAPSLAGAETSTARGEDLVQRNCAQCHAIGRTGASPNPQSPPFRELSRRYPVDNLAEALAEGIITGHPQMPEFRFAPDEVVDIIAYLKSIQVRQGAAIPPPPAHAAP